MKQRYTWRGIGLSGIVFCVLLTVFSIPFYQYLDCGYQYQDVQAKVAAINNEPDTSYDALFLGDSQGWDTYSPIQLYGEQGFTSYNACMAGQFPHDASIILKKFYEKKKTKLVVVDVNMCFTPVNVVKLQLMKVFPIFHYHNIHRLKSTQDYSSRKGFNECSDVVGYVGSLDYMNENQESSYMRLDCKRALNQINELCQKNNSKLLIVNSVNPLNWNQKRHDVIQKWCDEHDLRYLDYNDSSLNHEIRFDYSNDFRDGGDHLNLNGSKKICSNLGTYMKKNYGLSDHRKDEKYQTWNQLYANASEYHV